MHFPNLLWGLVYRDQPTVVYHPDMKASLYRMAGLLSLVCLLHILAMRLFEGMSLGDALWLTMTTITTVGYGDLSASTTMGRLSTVLFLYVGGIFILGKTAGDYFDYRSDRHVRKLKGEWRWELSDHIVILNTPASNGEQYFVRLIKALRATKECHSQNIQILTRQFQDGLPDSLRSLDGVLHFHGGADDVDALQAVNVDQASIVVVLAKEESDPGADGRTFDTLHRLKELGVRGKILAECVDDRNRQRLHQAGAQVVLRPIRAYPGMIVRAVVAPGSEQVIENLFTSDSDEYIRVDIEVADQRWKDIACALIQSDLGTPIAYIAADTGLVYCNPPADRLVHASALILIVREGWGGEGRVREVLATAAK